MAVNYNKNAICKIEFKKGEVSSKAVEKFLKQLAKHNTTVGIHQTEGSKVVGKNGYTLGKIAFIQEFGCEQEVKKTRRFKSPYTGKWFYIKKGTKLITPKRPFVRVLNRKSEKDFLTDLFKYYVAKHEKDGDWQKVYDSVGKYSSLRMQERIAKQEIKPKNADMTIEYKASSTPLVLHGDLFDAIKHEVH